MNLSMLGKGKGQGKAKATAAKMSKDKDKDKQGKVKGKAECQSDQVFCLDAVLSARLGNMRRRIAGGTESAKSGEGHRISGDSNHACIEHYD